MERLIFAGLLAFWLALSYFLYRKIEGDNPPDFFSLFGALCGGLLCGAGVIIVAGLLGLLVVGSFKGGL